MANTSRKYLFIASEVRSGSTYFAESLAYELGSNFKFATWNLTREHFSFLDNHSSSDDIIKTWSGLYLDACGFSTAKIMCKALSVIHRHASIYKEVQQAFFGENTYWIVLRRRNRIKQAISLAMANKTGIFHYYGEAENAPDNDTIVTIEEIESAMRMISLSDIYLEAFASTIPVSHIVSCFYEDFMEDEVSWLNRVHAMCGFPMIEQSTYINQAKLKPTANEAKRAAYAQYRQWFLMNYV
jgi:LPS sulfotransferase NodH